VIRSYTPVTSDEDKGYMDLVIKVCKLILNKMSSSSHVFRWWVRGPGGSHWPITVKACFESRPVYVGFVVDKVSLGQIFLLASTSAQQHYVMLPVETLK
jgi:hypothetical protein